MTHRPDPALHAHLFPRRADEPDAWRTGPVWAYPAEMRTSVPFEPKQHGGLMKEIAAALARR